MSFDNGQNKKPYSQNKKATKQQKWGAGMATKKQPNGIKCYVILKFSLSLSFYCLSDELEYIDFFYIPNFNYMTWVIEQLYLFYFWNFQV
jgi:hypothetical protein